MRCALPSHKNAQQRRETVELPTDSLGLGHLITLPQTISVNTVRCTYIPRARASVDNSHGNNMLGFFEMPVEGTGYAPEMDPFSEVQAYYSISSFFQNVRALLGDPTWCLRKSAMSCNADGSAVKNEQGIPVNPYKIFVNQPHSPTPRWTMAIIKTA